MSETITQADVAEGPAPKLPAYAEHIHEEDMSAAPGVMRVVVRIYRREPIVDDANTLRIG